MTAASHEMADLLREVQKLQKELQPVRSAVAALQKREAETPNPAAAGASLNKVAARLETVKQKYEPFLLRLKDLLAEEVPAYLQQTELLAASNDIFDAKAPETAAESSATLSPAAARSFNRSTGAETITSTTPARADDAPRILRDVCPPSTPHLLHAENVRFTQQQLRLRADMVDYLIATDRLPIADHVARAYGLPLQWFPRLVALHKERVYSTSTEAMAAAAAAGVGGVYSPTTGGRHVSSITPSASPLVTPATRPRGGGMPPKSPMQLPAAAAPARLSTAAVTPTAKARSPAVGPSAAASAATPDGAPTLTPARLPQRESQPSPATLPSASKRVDGVDDEDAAAVSAVMPDLVARVVSAAIYMKDDYFDRMVLERMLEQQLGLAPALAEPTSDAADTPSARYRACVLTRIAHIPRHHLHTQSGDPAFDNIMMNVIEDLLVYGLQRWAEDDTGMPESGADAQHGGESLEKTAAETKRRKAALLRTLTSDTLLTAEEMLLADKVWNEEILFLKRPTRFYCVETGLSTDEAAGPADTAPRARATGEVISQFVAESQGSVEGTTGIFIT